MPADLGPWIGARRADEPLVLAICDTPLLCEAVASAVEGAAIVRGFPAGRMDTAGLIAHVRPDAVVVDAQEEADSLEPLARETGIPLIHVMLGARQVRALRDDEWREYENPENSLTEIRNVLIGELFAISAHRFAQRSRKPLERSGDSGPPTGR
jgi:hypothetical protein